MKKTIQTKGRYTNSQERKETCSDGELPECCFPPREVLRILKGVNKSRRRLTRCRKEERKHGLHDNILNGLEIAGIIDRRYVNVDT
ncbi:hypothetical protein ACQJBY_030861 [Aegilops geniculata]